MGRERERERELREREHPLPSVLDGAGGVQGRAGEQAATDLL